MFKIGDVVTVIDSSSVHCDKLGIVTKINNDDIEVDFNNELWWYRESGLKLVTSKENEGNESDFVDAVCSIFDNLKETFRRKNQQYATADPLANFRTGAYMRTGRADYADMYEEAKNYQRKHIAHVQNNEINGSKVDESLTDIAVYAVLMKYMYDRHYDNVIAEWKNENE